MTLAAQGQVNLVRLRDHGGHGRGGREPSADDFHRIHVDEMHVDLSAAGSQRPETQLHPGQEVGENGTVWCGWGCSSFARNIARRVGEGVKQAMASTYIPSELGISTIGQCP